MGDIRVKKLAKLLINYSLELKAGEKFLIEGSDIALPLIKEVYREAIKVGAHPEIEVSLPGIKEILLKEGSEKQIKYISPKLETIYDKYDAYLTIWGDYNTKPLAGVNPKRISMNRAARKDLITNFYRKIATGKIKWCGTQFPTHSDAQEANMSLDEYEEFVYGAGLIYSENPVDEWKTISQWQQKICDFLSTKKELHIKSKDTDLKMKIEGRKWINCDGKENFPDGEVFTTPVKNSVNGYIRFTYPGIYSGKEAEDIRLTFKDGKIIDAKAAKGEDFLISLLDTDEGSRYVGEIAIGTNYGITKFTKNILFDEKIGGTIHLAVGAALEETGGFNESGIHWDMICDMKEQGQIFTDGQLIYEKGRFIIDF